MDVKRIKAELKQIKEILNIYPFRDGTILVTNKMSKCYHTVLIVNNQLLRVLYSTESTILEKKGLRDRSIQILKCNLKRIIDELISFEDLNQIIEIFNLDLFSRELKIFILRLPDVIDKMFKIAIETKEQYKILMFYYKHLEMIFVGNSSYVDIKSKFDTGFNNCILCSSFLKMRIYRLYEDDVLMLGYIKLTHLKHYDFSFFNRDPFKLIDLIMKFADRSPDLFNTHYVNNPFVYILRIYDIKLAFVHGELYLIQGETLYNFSEKYEKVKNPLIRLYIYLCLKSYLKTQTLQTRPRSLLPLFDDTLINPIKLIICEYVGELDLEQCLNYYDILTDKIRDDDTLIIYSNSLLDLLNVCNDTLPTLLETEGNRFNDLLKRNKALLQSPDIVNDLIEYWNPV